MSSKNPKAPARARVAKPVAKVPTPRRRPAAANSVPQPSETTVEMDRVGDTPTRRVADSAEQVRMRAYFLHLERRGRPGNPVEDWLAAEREMRGGAAPDA
jgi:hypothetical protein